MNRSLATLGTLWVLVPLFVSLSHQKRDQQSEQSRQTALLSRPRPLNHHPATSTETEDEKRILTFHQVAHDSMCRVFTAQLPAKMQAFLDMDYYLTIGQPHGAELGAKSGLVATRAVLESLAVDWPEGTRPATFEEAAQQIQTYTVVFTIYWQAADGTATGFYKFEHRFNLQTRDTLSVRLLQTGDI